MIIGLAGAKESGKNTAAEFITGEFCNEYKIKEHSFAAKLKQSAIAAITGIVFPVEQAIEDCDKLKVDSVFSGKVFDPTEGEDFVVGEFSFTGREFLQWYGTEAHREIFGQDFWVQVVMDEIPNTHNPYEWNSQIDLITDVRFPNEAEAVQNYGGKVVRINRQSVETGDTHASEKPLPDDLVDKEINNNGTLDQFSEKIKYATHDAITEMETK